MLGSCKREEEPRLEVLQCYNLVVSIQHSVHSMQSLKCREVCVCSGERGESNTAHTTPAKKRRIYPHNVCVCVAEPLLPTANYTRAPLFCSGMPFNHYNNHNNRVSTHHISCDKLGQNVCTMPLRASARPCSFFPCSLHHSLSFTYLLSLCFPNLHLDSVPSKHNEQEIR